MKTTAASLLALALVAGCAAPASSVTGEETTAATADLATTPASTLDGTNLYRGTFQAKGASFTLEVELVSKQTVKAVKYCEPADADQDAWASSSASPDYSADEPGGTIRTIVRDASGAVVAEAANTINSFSAYGGDVDPASQCTKKGLVSNLTPPASFSYADPLVWVPGVAAQTTQGLVWINPSYGDVAQVAISFQGSATYRSLSSKTSVRPRPFNSPGQELVFADGEMTFQAGVKEIYLDVGTDVDTTSFPHARHVETITLKRQ